MGFPLSELGINMPSTKPGSVQSAPLPPAGVPTPPTGQGAAKPSMRERFQQLTQSGMSKTDAFNQMQAEGY